MCECNVLYTPKNKNTLFIRIIETIISEQSSNKLNIKIFRRTAAYEILSLLSAYTSDSKNNINDLLKQIYYRKVG